MTAEFIMLSPFTWGTEDLKLQALQSGRTKRGAVLRNDCFVRIRDCSQGWTSCLSVAYILENGHHSAPMVVSVPVPEHMAHFWFFSHFQLTQLAQVLFWSVRSETDVGYISLMIWGQDLQVWLQQPDPGTPWSNREAWNLMTPCLCHRL